jgi:hypothetical protein
MSLYPQELIEIASPAIMIVENNRLKILLVFIWNGINMFENQNHQNGARPLGDAKLWIKGK